MSIGDELVDGFRDMTQVLEGPELSLSWDHGLGDTANFIRLIHEYQRHGYRFAIDATRDKLELFDLIGCRRLPKGTAQKHHGWGYPDAGDRVVASHGRPEAGNKTAANIGREPLPVIGEKADVWARMTRQRLQLHESDRIPQIEKVQIDGFLESLRKPVILLHLVGNTNRDIKSLTHAQQLALYHELLDQTDGTLVSLDWDNRCPRLKSSRFRHILDHGGCRTRQLVRLIGGADLLIGVDSGPLHVAGLTDTPALGLFTHPHTPWTYLVPRDRTLSAVFERSTSKLSKFKRLSYPLVEQPGDVWDAAWIARTAARMLGSLRWFGLSDIAADVQLQHWIEKCRGPEGVDRHKSFGRLFDLASALELYRWVEVGTIRAEEDWRGAGFSTYLFARYLQAAGGTLDSVDTLSRNLRFSQLWCGPFADTVRWHQMTGLKYLQERTEPIDVLYLDGHDADVPGHAQSCLDELLAALPRLDDKSLVLIDDCPLIAGNWTGKGGLAIPHLLHLGWQILYAGHQCLLRPPAYP